MKNKSIKINKSYLAVAMIMLISSLLLIYLTYLKEGMHVDEYLTYGLANYEGDGTYELKPEYGVRLSVTEVFDNYFYADDINIKNLWLNQGNNVHPPLYYLLFHFFTLVTKHFLALKTGVLLNIIFHVINIGLIWLILKEMMPKEYEALLGTVLYSFMPATLGSVLFVRMYVLLTIFVLCLTLLFVKEWDGTNRRKFYLILGLLSVCGTMTHYYFLIYLFFCCMIWGIRILKKRRWSELVVFLTTMIGSGIICILVFPYMLQHIFSGVAGKRTVSTLLSSQFLENGKVFWQSIDDVYGGFLTVIIIAIVLLLVFQCIFEKRDRKFKGDINRWTIIYIPCILFFLTVTKIAIMPAVRYITPIYGICIILLIGLFEYFASLMKATDKAKCVAGILMVGILLNGGFKTYNWTELHLDAKKYVSEAKEYGVNNECICVMDTFWRTLPCYQEFLQYQNLTYIQKNNLELLYQKDYSKYDHVVMYFDIDFGQEAIDEILQKMIEINPGLEKYEKLHQYTYSIAYYLD